MGTFIINQAGKEYTLIQSNNGLRVEHKGAEIFRHWPDTDTTPEPTPEPTPDPAPDPDPAPTPDPTPVPQPVPTGADVSNASELAQAVQTPGTYRLASGSYGVLTQCANGVTLLSADPENRAVIDGLVLSDVSGLTLDGLDLKYKWDSSHGNSYWFLSLVSCHDFAIQNCNVLGDVNSDGYHVGLALRTLDSDRTLINGNVFRHFNKGIVPKGNGITITNNDIGECGSDAISCDVVSDLVIEGNYLHDRTKPLPGSHGDFIQLMLDTIRASIRNNFMDTGVGGGIQGIHSKTESVKTDIVMSDNVMILTLANGISGGGFTRIAVENNVIVKAPNTDGLTGGVTIPKINFGGLEVTLRNNTAPKIYLDGIQVKDVDGNVWDEGDAAAVRAATRADPRFAHFFGG